MNIITLKVKAELDDPFCQCREMSSEVGQPELMRAWSAGEAWEVTTDVLDSQHCSMDRARYGTALMWLLTWILSPMAAWNNGKCFTVSTVNYFQCEITVAESVLSRSSVARFSSVSETS